MASCDIGTTREIIERQFTRQLRAAFRLYDADLLDECETSTRELLNDGDIPRWHRMKALILLASIAEDEDEAKSCYLKAESLWEDQADADGEECAAAEAHDDDDPMDVEDEATALDFVTDDMRKVSIEQGDVDRYVSRELEDWDTINLGNMYGLTITAMDIPRHGQECNSGDHRIAVIGNTLAIQADVRVGRQYRTTASLCFSPSPGTHQFSDPRLRLQAFGLKDSSVHFTGYSLSHPEIEEFFHLGYHLVWIKNHESHRLFQRRHVLWIRRSAWGQMGTGELERGAKLCRRRLAVAALVDGTDHLDKLKLHQLEVEERVGV